MGIFLLCVLYNIIFFASEFAGEECLPDQLLSFSRPNGSFEVPGFSSGKGPFCCSVSLTGSMFVNYLSLCVSAVVKHLSA